MCVCVCKVYILAVTYCLVKDHFFLFLYQYPIDKEIVLEIIFVDIVSRCFAGSRYLFFQNVLELVEKFFLGLSMLFNISAMNTYKKIKLSIQSKGLESKTYSLSFGL